MKPKLRFKEYSDDWQVVSLQEVRDLKVRWSITGGPFGSNLKNEDYTASGVRIIQLQNIGDGIFNDEYKIYTSETKANELLSCNIYPNEIIISKMGDPVARCCLIPTSSPRYVMSSDGIRLVVDINKFNNFYIHDYINSVYFRRIALEKSTGSTRKRIGLDELKSIPLKAPSLLEQTKIASFFSAIDEKITQLTKKNELLNQYKKGVMQKIFSQELRFKASDGSEYPDWEQKKLNELVSNFIVPMRDKPKFLNGEIPWCRIEDFHGRYLQASKSGQGVSPQTVNEMNLKVYPIDTLLVSCSANLGVCAIVKKELITNQTFIGLVPIKEILNIEFFYYLMSLSAKRLNTLSSGTTISYLSREKFEEFDVIVPSLKEQIKIASFLSAIDDKIQNTQAQLASAKHFKEGLLQQMFV
jgi:type I restriction enzyme S subunit